MLFPLRQSHLSGSKRTEEGGGGNSLEALMNALLDTREVLMINIAHVFLGNQKKKSKDLRTKKKQKTFILK